MKIKCAAAILLVLIISAVLAGCGHSVSMDFTKEGVAVFKYGDADVSEKLTEQELSQIMSIFDGKDLYSDRPSCGFSKSISVRINASQTFCFACDTCPIIYWAEKGKYFNITEEEQEKLYEILDAHGFSFPCV